MMLALTAIELNRNLGQLCLDVKARVLISISAPCHRWYCPIFVATVTAFYVLLLMWKKE